MSLVLAAPWALWGLLGLIVPVLLHLRPRQPTPRTLDFAALEFVPAHTRPRRRLRFRDLPLLLVRCLLLALLALALAKPSIEGLDGNQRWHLVHTGLDPSTMVMDAKGEWRWLAEGFPPLESDAPKTTGELASLLRDFDAGLPEDVMLTVHVPTEIDGLDGARLRLSRAVDWQVTPVGDPERAVEVPAASPLRLAIAGSSEHHAVMARIDALRSAWGTAAASRVELLDAQEPVGSIDTLLWLGGQDLPSAWQQWLQQGGRVVSVAPPDSSIGAAKADAVPLWTGARSRLMQARVGRGEHRWLECRLDPACLPELFEPEFADRMLRWLSPERPPARRALATAVAPLSGDLSVQPIGYALASLLALVLALLFGIERWMAARRPA